MKCCFLPYTRKIKKPHGSSKQGSTGFFLTLLENVQKKAIFLDDLSKPRGAVLYSQVYSGHPHQESIHSHCPADYPGWTYR